MVCWALLEWDFEGCLSTLRTELLDGNHRSVKSSTLSSIQRLHEACSVVCNSQKDNPSAISFREVHSMIDVIQHPYAAAAVFHVHNKLVLSNRDIDVLYSIRDLWESISK